MSKWYPRPRNQMSKWERAHWRLMSKVDTSDSELCWIWCGSLTSNGYGHLSYVDLYDERHYEPYAHRLSWALRNNRWPSKKEVVMHTCDNPPCVNPGHLIVGTQQQNIDDRKRSGRWYGTKVGKLNPEQVREIRLSNDTQFVVAQRYRVSQTAISNLRSGKTYNEEGTPKNELNGVGVHIRWHVKRDIYNPDCKFCTASLSVV